MVYILQPDYKSPYIARLARIRPAEEVTIVFAVSQSEDLSVDDSIELPDLLTYDPSDNDFNNIKAKNESGLLVSSRLYEILTSFILPKYTAYRSILTDQSAKVITDDYLYVVFESTLLVRSNVSLNVYQIIDRSGNTPSLIFREPIVDQDDLVAKNRQLRIQNKALKVDTYVIEGNLDVYWGGSTYVYINDEVKVKLEARQLVGVAVLPFGRFNIVNAPPRGSGIV